ncbi:MAG: hypothetical protein JWR69_3709 [Pedosphaera sp.]|nr:hypothetical protein [Pedosphaera sp.]
MKNLHQNLLIALAFGLCALCAWQWYGQTVQHTRIESLNQLIYEKSAAIQDYTNSIKTMDRQIAQMDGHLAGLKETIKTNDLLVLNQKRELTKLELTNEALANQNTEYKNGVATLEAKLKEAYDGVTKQNESIKELVTQRDEFVRKFNDSVKERNNLVSKYNELVQRVEKLQGTKPPEK